MQTPQHFSFIPAVLIGTLISTFFFFWDHHFDMDSKEDASVKLLRFQGRR